MAMEPRERLERLLDLLIRSQACHGASADLPAHDQARERSLAIGNSRAPLIEDITNMLVQMTHADPLERTPGATPTPGTGEETGECAAIDEMLSVEYREASADDAMPAEIKTHLERHQHYLNAEGQAPIHVEQKNIRSR